MPTRKVQKWKAVNHKITHFSTNWFRQHKLISTNYLAWYFNVTDMKASITTCCKMNLTKRMIILMLQPFIASPHTGMVQSETHKPWSINLKQISKQPSRPAASWAWRKEYWFVFFNRSLPVRTREWSSPKVIYTPYAKKNEIRQRPKNSYRYKRPSTRRATSSQHLSFLSFLSLAPVPSIFYQIAHWHSSSPTSSTLPHLSSLQMFCLCISLMTRSLKMNAESNEP